MIKSMHSLEGDSNVRVLALFDNEEVRAKKSLSFVPLLFSIQASPLLC